LQFARVLPRGENVSVIFYKLNGAAILLLVLQEFNAYLHSV
jgi:hypothetical protein